MPPKAQRLKFTISSGEGSPTTTPSAPRTGLDAERSDRRPDREHHGLVFPSLRGAPMEPENFQRSRGVLRQAADLGAVRFHNLRHTGRDASPQPRRPAPGRPRHRRP